MRRCRTNNAAPRAPMRRGYRPPEPPMARRPRMNPMTQQPFSRPGAIDLSGLGKQPAPKAGAPAGTPTSTPTGTPGGAGSSYSVVVDDQNFQGLLEQSMTAPV